MNFRSHINFLKPISSRKHRNGLDHIDLWRIPGALVYQRRELLTFVIGEIDNWLIVGIGYYLDNYLPFNNLIPKTWLTNPSHEPVSMFAFMKYCIILWLYDCENKSAFVIQSNEHFLFPLSSLLIRQSRSLLLCRTVLVKTYCQPHFHFLNDEMFDKCAWPFSSGQTKVLATLVLILLGVVIFFHPILFGRSVGKTSRAGETFAISLITCHGKCNIMIYDMNRDLKLPLIRCRLYISSTNVFLSTKYKI